LIVAATLLVSYPAVPQTVDPIIVHTDAVMQVFCFNSEGISAGTAFRVGGKLGLSVNHVTSSGKCFIAGKPVRLSYKSPNSDFSMIDTDEGAHLTADCGGYIKGRKYVALGYARGEKQIVAIEMTALGESDRNGQALFYSMVPVIPGQSGGPVLDEMTGRVVGVVNATNFEAGVSWSLPLKATPICKGATIA
jgi:hypothetical protein